MSSLQFEYFKSVVTVCIFIYSSCFVSAFAQINQKVENGSATESSIFPGGNCVYSWNNSNSSIGLAANGVGNIASFTAINNTSSPIIATITAVPIQPQFAYVPSYDGVVSIINTINNTVFGTVQAGAVPWGVAASKDGRRVYISNSESNSVTVINTADNSIAATITVDANPHGIAVSPDGSKVYVANTGPSYVSANGPNTVSVINTATNKVETTINVGKTPVGVAVSPDGTKVYITNYDSNTVSVINTATNKVTAEFNGGSLTWGITLNADGSRLYLTNPLLGSVSIINTADNTLLTNIQMEGSLTGIVITPDGKYAYVANASLTRLDVVDLQLNRLQQSISLDSSPSGVSISADGSRVYVTDYNSNRVSVISTATNKRLNTISISAPAFSIGNFLSTGVPCTGEAVSFTITVDPTPAGPTILASADLKALYTTYGTQSAAGEFIVSGIKLTAGILVIPPAGFEVSEDNLTYNTTLTIGGEAIVNNTRLYIRLAKADHVGDYTGNIVLSSAGTTNVDVLMPISSIVPASLIITADNKTRIYGTINPALTVSYNGFVNNENATQLSIAPRVATTATITSVAGVYPITASGAAAADYNISYHPGIITIVPLEDPHQKLIIPTAFTPNGDGVNDNWEITGMATYSAVRFNIFNRYGQTVYTLNGMYRAWDGTHNGKPMPTGVYYYIIDLKDSTPALSGYVLLLR